MATAGEQIISQIELWALVSIKWQFRLWLENRRVICWIDNEAARICSIKANSPSPTMRALTRALADMDVIWPAFSWVERVCSYSNPGDLPSRGRLDEAMRRFRLKDGGVVTAPPSICRWIIQLHQRPFAPALLSRGHNLSDTNEMLDDKVNWRSSNAGSNNCTPSSEQTL